MPEDRPVNTWVPIIDPNFQPASRLGLEDKMPQEMATYLSLLELRTSILNQKDDASLPDGAWETNRRRKLDDVESRIWEAFIKVVMKAYQIGSQRGAIR